MAKLTREQIQKWNEKMSNGFKLDVEYFLMHGGEKTAHKYIKIDDTHALEIKLMYIEERERKTNEYGCSFNVCTGRLQPVVWLTKWYTGGNSGMMTSAGLGTRVKIGDAQSKQVFSVLQALTALINDEDMLKAAALNKSENSGIMMGA